VLLCPLALAACSTSGEGLKALAIPDQLHLYYEDQEGDYDNRFVANRGFEQDTRSLGVGLSWNLTPQPQPARGFSREDLHAVILELRQEAAAATAAAVEASAPRALPPPTPEVVEAREVPEVAGAVPTEPAREEVAQEEAVPEPPPPETIPSVEIMETPVAIGPEVAPTPVEPKARVGAMAAPLAGPSIPASASHWGRIPILVVGGAAAILIALQLLPGAQARLARFLGHGKRA
jgi:hypothetical protein